MQKGEFRDFSSVRAVWPHVDLVRARGMSLSSSFNVEGNRYRLVASINWTYRAVYVKQIMTPPNTTHGTGKGEHYDQ
jgi:mRNA-degrading endonuclease HigB of HigAB toxin-antitoxin module